MSQPDPQTDYYQSYMQIQKEMETTCAENTNLRKEIDELRTIATHIMEERDLATRRWTNCATQLQNIQEALSDNYNPNITLAENVEKLVYRSSILQQFAHLAEALDIPLDESWIPSNAQLQQANHKIANLNEALDILTEENKELRDRLHHAAPLFPGNPVHSVHQVHPVHSPAADSAAVAGSHDPVTPPTEGLQSQSSQAARLLSAPPCLCGESPSLFPTPNNETQHAILQAAAQIVALLFQKNDLYGNSALEPIQVFSKLPVEEGMKLRMDDKLARIRNAKPGDPEDSPLDLEGYLLLNRARQILQSRQALAVAGSHDPDTPTTEGLQSPSSSSALSAPLR